MLFVAAVPPPPSPLSPIVIFQTFSKGGVLGGISVIRRGGRTFCGLGLQVHPDGSLVRNIFEDSCTEEGTGAGKGIFEGGFKFASSEERNNSDSTDSEV